LKPEKLPRLSGFIADIRRNDGKNERSQPALFTPAQRLSLDESPLELIGYWLQQVTHHRPAARLHEDFRWHTGDKLQAGQSATFVFGQGNPHGEVWRIRLLIAAGIGRHVRYQAD
jgi:hypothetical protein